MVSNFYSFNESSPRKELLHNIDPLEPKVGDRMFSDSFDNRIRAAIRVGHMKLLTGHVGKNKVLSPLRGSAEPLPLTRVHTSYNSTVRTRTQTLS